MKIASALKLMRRSEHVSVDFTTTMNVRRAFVERVRSDYNFRKQRAQTATGALQRMAERIANARKKARSDLRASLSTLP